VADVPGGLELGFRLAGGGTIRHRSPAEAVTLIDSEAIEPASVTEAALRRLWPILPENVASLRLELRPETSNGAFFHYAHGLKHHDGNCQRIAHGHRSRIEIRCDGERDVRLETDWAERWRDITIFSREDLVAAPAGLTGSAYRAAQGDFLLELPRERCYVVDTDTTIENLAQHVAETLARENPGRHIEARVFEGIDKGALGEAGGAQS
jgi:hypothetical protein